MIKKYKALPISVKAAIWFIICNCIQKSTQLVTTPIYTRLLSQSQYGQYTVFLSWIELIAILATLDLFYSGYNVGMSKFKKDRDNYTSAMCGLSYFITTICLIIVLIFSSFFARLLGMSEIHIIILIIYMYIFPIYQFWSAKKKFEYKYKSLVVVTFIMSLTSIITGTIFAIAFEDKGTAVLVAKILAEAIVSIPLLIKIIITSRKLFDWFYWKYALKFNLPLIPHYISTMILNHSDRIMILNICNASQAGIYSVAYSIAMIITIAQNAINSAMVPWLYDRISKNNLASVKTKISYIIITEAILNLIIIIVAPELLLIISTKKYMPAIWIIPPVTFGVFLTGIYGLFVNIELYFNNTKITAISSLIAAIVNIVLNYICIAKYGYIAAGYTTFISYLLLTIIHYIGAKNICKKKNIRFEEILNVKILILIIVSFLIITCLFMSLYKYIIIRMLLMILLFIIVFMNRKKVLFLFKEIKKNNK